MSWPTRLVNRFAPKRRVFRLPLVLIAAQTGSLAAVGPGVPPTLTVSGTASFTADAEPRVDGFEVRGLLGDEVGRAIPGAEIRVQANTSSGGRGVLKRCQAGSPRDEELGLIMVTADAGGRFCLVVSGLTEGTLTLSYVDPRGYFQPAERSVRLSGTSRAGLELGFEPPPSIISLDRPLQIIGLVARARGGATAPEGAELVLSIVAEGSERELARVPLGSLSETHRLSLSSLSFGVPGPARLLARLRAGGAEEPVETNVAVLRTATVALTLANPSADGNVEAGSALTIHAASALGPVASGVVEARALGRSIAAARVRDGRATLTLPEASSRELPTSVSIQYVGGGAGWIAGAPLELRVRPPARRYGRYVAWVAAAVLAALAVVLGWRRPARARLDKPMAAPRHRARVELLEAFGDSGGYRGFVRDAHDGEPVPAAALSFLEPGASGRVLSQIRVGADGAFAAVERSFPAGTLIEVTAPFHATLTAALPVPGVIELSLVSRRRALLDRLVSWAERHGKPWIRSAGEPTPAHVAGAAGKEGEPQVERWARALEQLAYGPNPPDAASEQSAGVTGDPKTMRERGID